MPPKLTKATADLIPFIQQRLTPGAPAGGMAQPVISSIQLSGTILNLTWGAVASPNPPVVYEIWKNTTPSSVGAQLIDTTANTHWSRAMNTSVATQIIGINKGFESGDLTGWSTLYPGSGFAPTVSGASVHSGAYACSILYTSAAGCSGVLISTWCGCQPSTDYTYSWWYNIPQNTAGNEVGFEMGFASNPTGAQSLLTTSTITSGWVNQIGTFNAGANTTLIRFQISFGALGGTTQVYLDDVSIIGLPPTTPPTTTLFSVRAQDALGNHSPYSTWLIAPQAASVLGDTAAAHLSLDPANVRIMSSTFASGVRGVKLSPDSIEGATIVSSTEPVAPFPGMVWIDTT